MNSEQTDCKGDILIVDDVPENFTRPVHDADRAGYEVVYLMGTGTSADRSTRFDFTGHQDARNGWL